MFRRVDKCFWTVSIIYVYFFRVKIESQKCRSLVYVAVALHKKLRAPARSVEPNEKRSRFHAARRPVDDSTMVNSTKFTWPGADKPHGTFDTYTYQSNTSDDLAGGGNFGFSDNSSRWREAAAFTSIKTRLTRARNVRNILQYFALSLVLDKKRLGEIGGGNNGTHTRTRIQYKYIQTVKYTERGGRRSRVSIMIIVRMCVCVCLVDYAL